MSETIEAIVEKNGHIRLLKPLHLAEPMRAIVTLLEPVKPPENSKAVLALLHSPLFNQAPMGDPAAIEATIQSYRQAWNDDDE